MSEHSLWQWLRGGILPPTGHYTRIESDSSAGFPDVHYTIDKFTGTMELKFCRKPKKEYPLQGKGNGFRDSQITWIEDEFVAGGWTVLVVELANVVYFYPPTYIKYINEYDQDSLKEAAMVSIKKRDPTAQQVKNLKRLLQHVL